MGMELAIHLVILGFVSLVVILATVFSVIDMFGRVDYLKDKAPRLGNLLEKRGAIGVLLLVSIFLLVGDALELLSKELPEVSITVSPTFAAVAPPQVALQRPEPRVVTVHGACKVTETEINPARSQQVCTGGTGVPSLRDRVLALNAHLTESDRNRFSNALSEFEDSGKRGDEIMYKLNIELGNMQREQQGGTFAKEIAKHEAILNDVAKEAKNYHTDFYQLTIKWQTLFGVQEEYIFGDDPLNHGSSLLGGAPTGYENYLESWKAILNKEDPATLRLLLFPMTDYQRNLNDFGKWRSGWRQRLSEMRDSIR
jgi:hypothetical protein